MFVFDLLPLPVHPGNERSIASDDEMLLVYGAFGFEFGCDALFLVVFKV